MVGRRGFIGGAVAMAVIGKPGAAPPMGEGAMYGMIGRIKANPGQRAALARSFRRIRARCRAV